MRRTLFLFITLQLSTISTVFNQTPNDNETKRAFRYTLLYSPSDIYFAFNKNYKPKVLTQKQLVKIKLTIDRVSDSLNFLITSTNITTGKVDTLKHVFQIVSAIDKKGQNVVWVNAVCQPSKNWRKRLMVVDDGGSCYYSFKINLTESNYFNLQINANP